MGKKSSNWKRTGQTRIGASLVAALFVAYLPLVNADEAALDEEAAALFNGSMAYLASQQSFTVNTSSSIEVVTMEGQKLQFNQDSSLALQRPNRLFAKRQGDVVSQALYYDGGSVTLHNENAGFYATVPAPDTIENMLDMLQDKLDIVAPAGDLLYGNAADLLMADVVSGFVVGKSVIDGVLCNHLAFRNEGTDWQVWVEADDTPLPRKMVVTSRDVDQAPQFAVQMGDWDLSPEFAAETFQFEAPEGAKMIEFLPAASPAQ